MENNQKVNQEEVKVEQIQEVQVKKTWNGKKILKNTLIAAGLIGVGFIAKTLLSGSSNDSRDIVDVSYGTETEAVEEVYETEAENYVETTYEEN